jgi:general L-amino acid transport system substrate-binding protein
VGKLKAGPAVMGILLTAFVWGVGAVSLPCASAGVTLERIRSKKVIDCGVTETLPGFASQDGQGRWQGFMVDFGRAVASAALGNGEKVAFAPLTSASRFPQLLSGRIDLLAHNATLTFEREAAIGVQFAGVYFFDGQTFLVPRTSRFRKIEDFKGATIGMEKKTTHPAHLESAFRVRRIPYKVLEFDSFAALQQGFLAGRCQACSSDRSKLAAMRAATPDGANRFVILEENISKEPLGPVVRRGDEEWALLIRWVLFALLEAEERGVTRENVGVLQKKASDPGLQWFLNSSGEHAKSLGVKPGWVADVVAYTGNYGEIYERNFGSQSPLKMKRGLNRLWNQGGLLFSPPFQ